MKSGLSYLLIGGSIHPKEVVAEIIAKRFGRSVNHPDFIKKVAENTKLPFLIFDENGTYETESEGASAFIKKIEPFTEKDSRQKDRFAGFIVYPSNFLKEPPILQAINGNTPFLKPKRINTIDWEYRISFWTGISWAGSYDKPPPKLFKLEIIK